MTKLDEGFDALGRTRTPDLWSDIDRRQPRGDVPEGPTGARRIATVVLAIAIAMAGIGFAVAAFDRGSPQPADTLSPVVPTSELIAFPVYSQRGDTAFTRGLDIAVMDPDGSGFQRITGQPADLEADPWVAQYGYSSDDSPAFSPDGSTIAFFRRYGEGIDALCTIGIDGTGFRVLVREPGGGGGGELAWSPDGAMFAYYAGGQIHVANADGSGDHTIAERADGAPNQDAPSWLPDSSQVVFTAGTSIDVAAADGSSTSQVTRVPRYVSWTAVSPDGTAVAMVMQGVENNTADVWLVGIDGSNLWRVSADVRPYTVTWSPDGRSLLIDADLVIDLAAPGDPALVTGVHRLSVPDGVRVEGASAWWGPPVSTPTSPAPTASIDVVGPVAVGVPFQTDAIVASRDALWVSYYDDSGGKLAKIDPDTLQTIATIDGVPSAGWDSGGGGLAFDGSSVWVAGGGELVEVDTSTDRIMQRIPLAGDGAADVVAGALGWWVLETATQPDRMIIESVDPTRGSATVTTTLPYAYARRILAVGGYLAVVSLEQSDPAGGVGDPRLTLLDWEAGGSAIGSEAGQPFTSAQLVSDGTNGWAFDGSNLVELDGVNLLQPLRTIPLPIARPDRLGVGAGGIWVVAHDGDLLRVDPSTGRVDYRASLPEGAGWSDAAATNDALYLMSADGTVTRISAGP
jgi:hypothetical protein